MAKPSPGLTRLRRVLATGVALALGTGALAAATAQADTPVHQGHDVSWPQCPAGTGTDVGGGYGVGAGLPMPPTTTDFFVIGLTAGLPFTTNPCLASQLRFTLDHDIPRGGYTMTAYPTAAQLAAHGTAGPKPGATLAERLYNTGYAMARHDLATMQAVGLRLPWVWIDVEPRRVQDWPTADTAGNRAVLSGVAAGFRNAGVGTGWYSARTLWSAITGNWQDGAPMWKAGDYTTTGYPGALSICSTPSLNGGPIWMAQRVSGSYDLDVTCPALPSMATVFDGAVPPSLTGLAASPVWTVPGGTVAFTATLGTTQTWQATLTDACSGSAVQSWSGTAGGPLTVSWPTRDASGTSVPAGDYRFTLTSVGITRSVVVEVSPAGVSALPTCSAQRVFGIDRWATSVAAGTIAAPSSDTVVVTSGSEAHLVDALVAAPLARALGAPLLLTAPTTLPDAVRADVVRRHPSSAVVVGGPAAVGDAVVTALRDLGVGTVSRVAGADRWQTAAAVARRLAATQGGSSGAAWVASGDATHLVDALAAGGAAARAGQPVLLTAAARLPAATATVLADLLITRTTVAGGPSAVSAAVVAALPSPTRVAGVDRWSTAAAIADTVGSGSGVVVTAGTTGHLVDALAAGSLGGATLLTAPAQLPAPTADWLAGSGASQVTVVGGPAAVSPAVVAAAGSALAGG